MSGCRHNAKNTLVKNYLHLAERAGTVVHPLTTVTRVRPLRGGGYAVDTAGTGTWRPRRDGRTFTAGQVVFAAGAWGTQQLLHRMKSQHTLPRISDRLGVLTRTNSEALAGAMVRRRSRTQPDFTRGVAITSSIHPDAQTHIGPCRYGKGSNSMGLLTTVMTDGGGRLPRWAKWLTQVARHPGRLASIYLGGRWSERALIGLVMQTHDNSITVYPARSRLGRFTLTSRQGHGRPNPTWIPAANDAMRRVAAHIDGFLPAVSARSSTSECPPTSSGVAPSAIRPTPASSTPIIACSAITVCTSWTARRSPPTSASTRR